VPERGRRALLLCNLVGARNLLEMEMYGYIRRVVPAPQGGHSRLREAKAPARLVDNHKHEDRAPLIAQH
jgi:hypothetical protein